MVAAAPGLAVVVVVLPSRTRQSWPAVVVAAAVEQYSPRLSWEDPPQLPEEMAEVLFKQLDQEAVEVLVEEHR